MSDLVTRQRKKDKSISPAGGAAGGEEKISPGGGRSSSSAAKSTNHYKEGGPPDRPCHVAQDSLFSSSSGYTNYRGFFNLSLILLTLSNVRVALENVIKYGILIDPVSVASLFCLQPYRSPIVWLVFGLNAFILPCMYVERRLANGQLTDKDARNFYLVNLAAVLVVPAVVIILTSPNPFAASFCLGFYSVTFFKLISYAHVNYWLRTDYRTKHSAWKTMKSASAPTSTAAEVAEFSDNAEISSDSSTGGGKKSIRPGNSASSAHNSIADNSKDPLVEYPQNLTVTNLYYFMLAPTLCYQLNYPRTFKRRKWFMLKRVFEFVFLFQAALALCQQWIVPLLKNSLEPFIEMNYGRMLERLLKLAVPNHVIWLLSFYWLFHAFLNLMAELLRFADRHFYNDWWNAENIQYFWQNWNIPVHRWCVRHLYIPMVSHGFSKIQASCIVFMISALFHEYLLSIPLRLFRIWAFTGMLAQIPLNIITTRFVKGRAGNIIVWLSLILGQPLAILMYVHDWYVVHHMQQSSVKS